MSTDRSDNDFSSSIQKCVDQLNKTETFLKNIEFESNDIAKVFIAPIVNFFDHVRYEDGVGHHYFKTEDFLHETARDSLVQISPETLKKFSGPFAVSRFRQTNEHSGKAIIRAWVSAIKIMRKEDFWILPVWLRKEFFLAIKSVLDCFKSLENYCRSNNLEFS